MAIILVTAGPTREYLDDIRYLANGSSGRMGFAIAEAASHAGHEVRLIAGPTELEPPAGVAVERVVSAREMHAAALRAFEDSDVAFGVAAVADFRPAARLPGKPSKDRIPSTLELVPNPDIVADLGSRKGARVVVGFALEPADEGAVDRARAKLRQKRLDLCVLNAPAAMGTDAVQATLIAADGSVEDLGTRSKRELAAILVARAVALREVR